MIQAFFTAPLRGKTLSVAVTEIVSVQDCFLRADKVSFLAVAACRLAFCFAEGWFRRCCDADFWHSIERSRICFWVFDASAGSKPALVKVDSNWILVLTSWGVTEGISGSTQPPQMEFFINGKMTEQLRHWGWF